MITLFRHWLKPPVFDGDPQKTFRASLLNIMLIAALSLTILVTVGNLFDKQTPIQNFFIDFLFLVTILFFRHTVFKGRIKLVSNGLLITTFILITISLANEGSISSPTASSFMFIMIASGILFDAKGVVLFTLGSSLAVGLVALAQNAGMLSPHKDAASLIQWFVLTVMFGVAGWMVLITQHAIQKALLQTAVENEERKRGEAALRAALSEKEIILNDLQTYQVELEWQNSELSRVQAELELSRDRYLDLYDLAPVGYCILGQNGLILDTNLTAATLLGNVRSNLLDKPFSLFCAEQYQDVFYLSHRKLIASRAQQTCELQMLKQDGTAFWVALEAIFIPGENNVSLTRVVMSDISDRKQAEADLKASEERFRLMFENHQAVMMLVEPITGQILDANVSAAEFYGYPRPTLLSKTIFEINTLPIDQIKFEMSRAEQGKTKFFVFPHRLASGDVRLVEVHSSPLNIREKRVLFSIVHDITERKRLEEQLQLKATTDELTGIYNRHHFMESATQELNRALRHNHPLTVAMIDLDHFKQINDRYGHVAGDQALIVFSQIIQKEIRNIDVFARYGGDEFVLLFPETNAEQARDVIERVRLALTAQPIELVGKMLSLTLSSGIASLTYENETLDALLSHADQVLYRAKEAGRNRVEIAS
ncbi:MAG: sensor domain-containing diguanylate cyclase [Chloroflexi bacterium]|nr:sensor domain-containing diguanylate cyclase [Chloroflexota bacterium]